MKFNNRENEIINSENIGERQFFHSRSIALLCVVICKRGDSYYTLLEKRAEHLDQPLKWCVPCGYLDWDETGEEGVIREVYEETGLNLNKHRNDIIRGNLNTPYYVDSNPSSNRQNVTMRYGIVIYTDRLPRLKSKYCDEILELKWVDIKKLNDFEFAFNHDRVIISFFNSNKLCITI